MLKSQPFIHMKRGEGRPQILLVGNGLERCGNPTIPDPMGNDGQLSWNDLVDAIKVANCISVTEDEKRNVPFPLLYSLLSMPNPAPSVLKKRDIADEEARLKNALGKLSQASYPCLDFLRTINAHHIMTTNYNYGLEQAFFPGKNFMNSWVRSANRFNLNAETRNKKTIREICYRMHSGYIAKNSDDSPVGLWHIHGECSVPRGVVLGHDRYGRLLSRIERICDTQISYDTLDEPVPFTSWPELFLFGDVYIVGFGFDLSEFDLWWLLKRKQRENRGDGRVYFYEQPDSKSVKQKLLRAHGVELPEIIAKRGDYLDYYINALSDVRARVESNRRVFMNAK